MSQLFRFYSHKMTPLSLIQGLIEDFFYFQIVYFFHSTKVEIYSKMMDLFFFRYQFNISL